MIEEGRSPRELVFYDGTCGLCHAIVGFVVRFDRRGAFLFAPIGGPTFLSTIPEEARETIPDSVLVRRNDGSLLDRSRGVFHILARLGGYWRVLAVIGSIVPRFVADPVYDAVAGARRRLFARPDSACPIVSPGLRSRFLD